jgi:hypothetical protein
MKAIRGVSRLSTRVREAEVGDFHTSKSLATHIERSSAPQRVSIFWPHGISRRRQYLKKQTGSKKLILSKETLAQVTQAYGGSQINDTVYHVPASQGCFPKNSNNCGYV